MQHTVTFEPSHISITTFQAVFQNYWKSMDYGKFVSMIFATAGPAYFCQMEFP